MSRARGALCRACLALAAALAALLLLPLPRVPAPAPAPAPAPTPTPGPGPRGPPGRAATPRLRPEDVFIAVKTTRKNHGPRLGLLLRTWISRARRQTFIFTDGDDPELQLQGGFALTGMRRAECTLSRPRKCPVLRPGRRPRGQHQLLSRAHSPGAVLQDVGGIRQVHGVWAQVVLPCRRRQLREPPGPAAAAVHLLPQPGRLPGAAQPRPPHRGYREGPGRWNCDHCQVLVRHRRGRLLPEPGPCPQDEPVGQVTLSYGGPENPQNVVSVAGGFSLQQDPTRFKSVHCLLYPDTDWCPMKKQADLLSQ
ncbi:beta-1,3-N-acetylglucosaminyltransferase radical fringe isoform X3 [Rousettus aegyptiacus]|uniref:beta-1,3-N-acetylglucosaminyltransferase radical fringe isoform X3 n=1 Tax=Rousettus aegyptiacus TaxID=9407 RepID=UPI00168D0552|nr:beta-1,3-N-acetylglucosaminyltransferase radical fringe isoform X3 [Rousettus aegyptiacus]